MDDFGAGSAESTSGEDDGSRPVVVLVHVVVIIVVIFLSLRCCRRASQEVPADAVAEPCQLQPRKQLSACYALWLCGGLVGAHHFYMERLCHGMMAVWTVNFCGAGWVLDAFLMSSYLRGFNSRRVDPEVSYDTSCRRLMVNLPSAIVSLLVLVCAIGLHLPAALHYIGAVDIDRLAAQTERNPYDVLEISRTASLQEAKAAYRKLSLKWHPDRNLGCGKPCDDRMSEITKAFELVKKRRTPVQEEDNTWSQWLKDKGEDWWSVLEIWSADKNRADAEKPKAEKDKGKGTKSEL